MPDRYLTVRPAEVSDAVAITAIHVRSWQAAYRGILPDTYLDGLSRDVNDRRARWRTSIGAPGPDDMTAVAVDEGGDVVGWVTCGPPRDEDIDANTAGELWAIYVDPDNWREGTGSALMSYTIDHFTDRGLAEAVLWVFERNARARGFYERWGWRHDGSSTLFERGGGQAVEFRYRKPISPAPTEGAT